MFYADVDMILAPGERRSAQGHLAIHGVLREQLTARHLKSKILQENGPAGGNPLVRLIGSRTQLELFLRDFEYEGVEILGDSGSGWPS